MAFKSNSGIRNLATEQEMEAYDPYAASEQELQRIIAPPPAVAPVASAPIAPAPAATNFWEPTNYQASVKEGNVLQPIYGTTSSGHGEEGQMYEYGPVTGVRRYKEGQAAPGQTYEMLDPATGKVIGTGKFEEQSKGFFGDLWGHVSSTAADLGPILQFTPLGPAVAAINAVNAARTGDFLPAVASVAGLGGYTDIANAAKAASALKNEDYLGAIMPGLSAAGVSDVGGFSTKDIGSAVNVARAIESENPLALLGAASAYLPSPDMFGTSGTGEEGFFDYGSPGFMPTEELSQEEVDRELRGLLSRYPAPTAPSDLFLGENVPSGIPEWDYAAASAGLPIGNLEQDFSVAQTKTGPVVTDSAGNVGAFVNGEFVPDTGLTPSGAPSAAPALGKAPAPGKPAAPAAPGGPSFDPLTAFLFGAMMTPQQQKQQEQYQTARTVASPFGMDLIL